MVMVVGFLLDLVSDCRVVFSGITVVTSGFGAGDGAGAGVANDTTSVIRPPTLQAAIIPIINKDKNLKKVSRVLQFN